MPRIPQDNADAITNGEVERGGNRKAFTGYALVRLVEADETDPKDSGYAGQDLKFEVVEPREAKGWYVWEYMSYDPRVNWKWMGFFEAFGFEANSDTDEIIAEGENAEDPAYAIIETTIEITTKGKNKGKGKTKVQDYLSPADPDNYKLIGVEFEDGE